MIKTLFSILFILAACQVQSQTLRIATDPSTPPFESLVNGTVVGFDIDFLAAVSKVGGFQYEIVQIPWTELFAAVLNSTVDLAISDITINAAREEIYSFSVPYFISSHVILAPEGTDIKNAQDLLGKTVAVKNGTTGQAAVEAIFGGDSPNIKSFTDVPQALQALTSGSVDAYVDDSGILENFANHNPGYVIITDPKAFPIEFYGLMFPKGSSLVAEFNPDITTVLNNGEYTTIYTTWFGSVPDVALLLAAGEDANPYEVFEEAIFVEEANFIGEENLFTELGEMNLLL